ncbi:MAG: hypothetical protein ACI9PP_000443 [Halobacteriales archaeon]|jgi:hypothetical protein
MGVPEQNLGIGVLEPLTVANDRTRTRANVAIYFLRNDLGVPKMSAILRNATVDEASDGPVDQRATLWAGLFCSLFDVDPEEKADADATSAD